MFASISVTGKPLRFGSRCFAAVLVACLGLPGCANLDIGGSETADGQISDLFGPVRPADSDREFFGVSNKAREIERNCMR